MRVLQVITSLHTGGAEKLIIDLVPRFQKKGYQVDLLLFDGCDTPLKRQLEGLNINLLSFGINCNVYNPIFIFKLLPIIKKYDIIHTHNTACQYFVALAKLFYRGKQIKFVTTEHSTNNRRRNFKFWKFVDHYIYSKYDKIVAISEEVKNSLKNILFDVQIEVIKNGIDIQKYEQSQAVELIDSKSTNICLITMISRFGEAKDQETVIRTLSFLPAYYYLLLVGGGDETLISRSKRLILDLNLKDRVIFLGVRNDVPNILKSSDIIVQSSHWEGFGLAALEGMAAGKPVVATNVPGLAQVVGGAGILFPHGDAKALADIILRLHEDPVYYQQIVNQCLQRAAEFDIHKTVDQYLQLYQSLYK